MFINSLPTSSLGCCLNYSVAGGSEGGRGDGDGVKAGILAKNALINWRGRWRSWAGQGRELIYVFPDPEENSGNPFLLMFTREDICLVWPGWAPARPYRHILAAIWQLKVWRVVCKYRRVLVLPLDIWHQHMLYETLFMGYRLLIG